MRMVDYVQMSKNIAEIIERRGLTIQETATVMECSSKTIKNWISGRTKPTIRHLFAFAKEMNVSINDIIVIR